MERQEQQKNSPLTLFYAFADQDTDLRQNLEKHLTLLVREKMIIGWHRHQILPGADTNQSSDEQFLSAQMILLLISPDFLASDTGYAEMERAFQRQAAGLAHVLPLLLRPVDWKSASIAHVQTLPRNGRAVTQWENRDEAFAEIAQEMRVALAQWYSPSPQQQPSPPSGSPPFFLSFARKDLPLLRRLKHDLQALSSTEKDESNLPPSENPEKDQENDGREAIIRSASAVVVVATPQTRRSRQVKHDLDIASMYQRPIYLFWIQGDRVTDVMPAGWKHLPALDARGERYARALQDLVLAFGRRSAFTSSPSRAPEDPARSHPVPRNPYKGLQAFRTEDARDFFGRDRLIEELLAKLKHMLSLEQFGQSTSRLLTLLGPSGSGKSSVVMAGLLPRLKRGALGGSEHWIYLNPMLPGKHPLEALTLTLPSLFPERSLKSIREDLQDDSTRGLHLLLMSHVQSSGVKVLIVIDQFEELFTQTATEDERQQFLDILLAAFSEPHGLIIGLLILRADFYDRPFQYPALGNLIKSHQVLVFPPKIFSSGHD
jgi:hypothetical protein